MPPLAIEAMWARLRPAGVGAVVALCISSVAWAWACGGDSADLQKLSRISAPHMRAFDEFERWALRALAGDDGRAEQAALEEAVFAPILRRRDVLAATVVHRQARTRRLVFPTEARFPVALETLSLRGGGGRPVRAVAFERCPLGLPGWWRRGVSRRCVILSRDHDRGLGETLAIGVAFSVSEPAGEAKATTP